MWRSDLHRSGSSEIAEAKPNSKPLAERLAEITARVEQLLPPEKRAANERAIQELEASGLAEKILPIGVKALEFALPDAKGKIVRSADLLAKGKLVVVFFRGRWCPYCVAQLEFLNEIYQQLREHGAEIVALSPQTPKQTAFTAEQHKLSFPVLSDAGNQVARQFRIVYRVPEYLEEQYKRTFINLPHINGDASWELPMPATFVIAQHGTVMHAKAAADYRKRAEVSECIGKV